jgi:hypothetical protein
MTDDMLAQFSQLQSASSDSQYPARKWRLGFAFSASQFDSKSVQTFRIGTFFAGKLALAILRIGQSAKLRTRAIATLLVGDPAIGNRNSSNRFKCGSLVDQPPARPLA